MKILKANFVDPKKHAVIDVRVPKRAENNIAGSFTFYFASESKPGTDYVIRTRKAITRPFYQITEPLLNEVICSCEDFVIRRWATHTTCKHIDDLTALAQHYGSVELLASVLRQDHEKF